MVVSGGENSYILTALLGVTQGSVIGPHLVILC